MEQSVNHSSEPAVVRSLSKNHSSNLKASGSVQKVGKSGSKLKSKGLSKFQLEKDATQLGSPAKTSKGKQSPSKRAIQSPEKGKSKRPLVSIQKVTDDEGSHPVPEFIGGITKKPSLMFERSFSKMSNSFMMNPSLAELDFASGPELVEKTASKLESDSQTQPQGKFAPKAGWQEEMMLWESTSELLAEATNYYKRLFGDIITLPESIQESEEYITQNPVDLIEQLSMHGVEKSETHLYWIVRMSMALPLPPEYVEISSTRHSEALGGIGHHKMYLHKINLLYLPVHPGSEYINLLIRQMRRKTNVTGVDNTKFKDFGKIQEFKDPFGVRSKVDLYLLRLAYDGEHDLYQKYVQNNQQMLEELQIENGYKFKSVGKLDGSRSKLDIDEIGAEDGKQGLSRAALANIFKHTKGITDLLILEVCRQAKLDLEIEPELLGVVSEFVMCPPEKFSLGTKGEEKNKLVPQKWESRCPDGKTFFWVNPTLKRAQAVYPYLPELELALDKHRRQVHAISILGKYKRDASKLSFLFRDKDAEKVKQTILQERQNIISRSVIKRGGKLEELKKELKTLKVNIDEETPENPIGSSGRSSVRLSLQGSSDDSVPVSRVRSRLMSRKDSIASQDKRGTVLDLKDEVLQLPKRPKGLPRASNFGHFLTQKKEKEKAQEDKRKVQAAKQTLRQLTQLLGGAPLLDHKYQVVPYDLKPFVNSNFKQLFSKEQVLDAVHYCLFDMTERLDNMVKSKLKSRRLFERLYDEEEERIRKALLEEKKRLVREERRIARELAKKESGGPLDKGKGVGEFLDRVKSQINRTKLLQAQCGDLSLNSDSKLSFDSVVKNFMKIGPNFDKKYKDLKTAFESRKRRVIEELKKGNAGTAVYKNKKRRQGSGGLDNGSDTELDKDQDDYIPKKLNRSFNDAEDFEYESSDDMRSFQQIESQDGQSSDGTSVQEGSNSSDMLDSEEQDKFSNRPVKGRRPMDKKKVKIKQKNSRTTFLTSTDGTRNRRESMLLDLPSRKKILEGVKADQASRRMSVIGNPNARRKDHKSGNNVLPAIPKSKHNRNNSLASSIQTKSGDSPSKKDKQIKKPRFRKKDQVEGQNNSDEEQESSVDSESSNKLSDLFPSYKPSRKISQESQDYVVVAGITKKELIEDKKVRTELQNKQEQRVKLRDVLLDFVRNQSTTNNKMETPAHVDITGKNEGFSQRAEALLERDRSKTRRQSLLAPDHLLKNFQIPVSPQNTKQLVSPTSPFAQQQGNNEPKASSESLPRVSGARTPPLKDAGSAITKVVSPQAQPKPFNLLPADVFDPSKNFFDIMDKLAATDVSGQQHANRNNRTDVDSDNKHYSELQLIKQRLLAKKKEANQLSRIGLSENWCRR